MCVSWCAACLPTPLLTCDMCMCSHVAIHDMHHTEVPTTITAHTVSQDSPSHRIKIHMHSASCNTNTAHNSRRMSDARTPHVIHRSQSHVVFVSCRVAGHGMSYRMMSYDVGSCLCLCCHVVFCHLHARLCSVVSLSVSPPIVSMPPIPSTTSR